MKRAYSQLTIKSIDEDERVIEGIASTPSPDRLGDIVDPEGAEYALPLPLLWQHNSREPIGHVEVATVSAKGITIRARVKKWDEPGKLKDRLDEAWQTLKAGLVRGLSIGFTPLESARIKDTYSEHFLKWNWLELSCVTIAANADASITAIKSIDQQILRAALGDNAGTPPVVRLTHAPGVSGSRAVIPKGISEMNIAEQIASFEAKRVATTARMDVIMSKAAEQGRTLDETETQEYDGLSAEIKAVDAHLVRLKEHEKTQIAKATAITPAAGADPAAASAARAQTITVQPNVEKGVRMARFAMTLVRSKGVLTDALAIFQNNKAWMDTTPEVATVLKAAVAAGDTTTAGWAAELVYAQNLATEFIELLRPQTILGRIPGLRRVPFNIRVGGVSSGTTGYFVGEGLPIPVSKMTTTSRSLGQAKAAGLVVLDEELIRSSSPSAEIMVRDDLTKTIAQLLDVRFVDPSYAGVANVSPASITSGVTPVAATGTTQAALIADVQTLFRTWIVDNVDPTGAVWIMTATMALSLSLMKNSLGQRVYPDLSMQGGTFFGLPVVVSQSAQIAGSPASGEGGMLILVNARDIFLADDGEVTISASNEASIQMLDNPTNQSTAGTVATTMVSMFQTVSTAIRAIRFINWAKRRDNAVAYIKDANYIT